MVRVKFSSNSRRLSMSAPTSLAWAVLMFEPGAGPDLIAPPAPIFSTSARRFLISLASNAFCALACAIIACFCDSRFRVSVCRRLHTSSD